MNIPSLNNLQINNQLEINNLGFVASAFNKAVRVVSSKNFVKFATYTVISACSLTSYSFLKEDFPKVTIVYTSICPCALYIADKLIDCIYKSNTPRSPRNLAEAQNINNNIVEMIVGNQGSFWKIGRQRTFLNITYAQLKELPDNYFYNDSGTCGITWDPLKQGDAVCCDQKLYSFKTLKLNYEKHNGKTIPHSRNPIIWEDNIYKLPEYGISSPTTAEP